MKFTQPTITPRGSSTKPKPELDFLAYTTFSHLVKLFAGFAFPANLNETSTCLFLESYTWKNSNGRNAPVIFITFSCLCRRYSKVSNKKDSKILLFWAGWACIGSHCERRRIKCQAFTFTSINWLTLAWRPNANEFVAFMSDQWNIFFLSAQSSCHYIVYVRYCYPLCYFLFRSFMNAFFLSSNSKTIMWKRASLSCRYGRRHSSM